MDIVSIALIAVIACVTLGLGIPLFRYAQRNSAFGVQVQVLERDIQSERNAARDAEARVEKLRTESDELRSERDASRLAESQAQVALEALHRENDRDEERNNQARKAFQLLSAEVLEQQRKSFMLTANATLEERDKAVEKIVKPLRDQLGDLEQSEVLIKEKIDSLEGVHKDASEQSQGLLRAFMFQPNVSGEWGENSVEHILQSAGMTAGSDYIAQPRVNTKRPDFRLLLPGGREIFIDSKVSTKAFLKFQKAASTDQRNKHRQRFRANLRKQIENLSAKDYGGESRKSADHVIMAIPDFAFLMAIEHASDLFEFSASKHVIMCPYSMLIPLAHVVRTYRNALNLTEEGAEIKDLLKALYEGLADFSATYSDMGKQAATFVALFNEGADTLAEEIEPVARKLKIRGIPTPKDTTKPEIVNAAVRYYAPADHYYNSNTGSCRSCTARNHALNGRAHAEPDQSGPNNNPT